MIDSPIYDPYVCAASIFRYRRWFNCSITLFTLVLVYSRKFFSMCMRVCVQIEQNKNRILRSISSILKTECVCVCVSVCLCEITIAPMRRSRTMKSIYTSLLRMQTMNEIDEFHFMLDPSQTHIHRVMHTTYNIQNNYRFISISYVKPIDFT